MRYSVRLFDANNNVIAALTRLADLQLTRRLNDAWELAFAVTPAQHGAEELAMGSECVLYEGETPVVRAHITERDFTVSPWQFRAESTAVLLKRLQTPGQWSYQGWSPEEAIEDLLTGYRVANQGSSTDWADATLHQVTPLTLGDGDEVLLLERQPNGSYHTEGYAILPVVDLGPDCTDITRLRWAQSIGLGQRLSVQVRMGNTAAPGAGWTDWSAQFERVDSEAGAAIAGQGYRYAQVRADFYTDDIMAPNPDGEPQGYSPVLYATEVVGRYAGPITAGSIQQGSGLVLDETMIFDHTDHLAAIARICEAVGWQWYVDAGDRLHAGPALGADLSGEVIYREGRNCRVTAYREDHGNIENVILGLGAGQGVGQLRVEYRHEESIAKYGERRGRYVNTAQTSKIGLLSEVQEYAAEHAEPVVQVAIEVKAPPQDWPLFQVGDRVRFVSERRGVSVVLPIEEEQRTLTGVTLGLNTSLNAMRDLLIDIQRPKPGTGDAVPPAPPVDISATPGIEQILLRWTGQADHWVIEYRTEEDGPWMLLEAEWRSRSYAHAGQPPGEPRWYRVYAVRGGLVSGPSAAVNAVADSSYVPDTTAPVEPEILGSSWGVALQDGGRVYYAEVTFAPIEEPDLREYRVYEVAGGEHILRWSGLPAGEEPITARVSPVNPGVNITLAVVAVKHNNRESSHDNRTVVQASAAHPPANVSGLAGDFSGPDCRVSWAPVTQDADGVQIEVAGYKVEAWVGGELRRVAYPGGTEYTYAFAANERDNGSASPVVEVRVWAIDSAGQQSTAPAVKTCTNEAPGQPTVEADSSLTQIRWRLTSAMPRDFREVQVSVGEYSQTVSTTHGVIDLREAGVQDGSTALLSFAVVDMFGQESQVYETNVTGRYLTREDMQGGLFSIEASITNLPGAPIPLTFGSFDDLWDGDTGTGAEWDGAARITFRYPMMWLFDMVRLWTGSAVPYYVEVEAGGHWVRAIPETGTLTTKAGAWTVQRFRRMFATQAVRITFPDASSPDLRELKFWTITMADEILAQKIQVTDSMFIESANSRTRLAGSGLVVDDGEVDRIHTGDISGRPWGSGALPEGTYGTWGDNAGLYLRGYANTLLVGYAQDEELIDLSAYNPANPQIMVAPKSVLTYSPQQKDAIPVIFTDAVQEEDGKFRIKAKTLIRGAYSSWPVGWTEGNDRKGAWQQPQIAAPNGKKGVDTNFIRCRVHWFASGAYVIGVDQWVTNEFDASGQPINWQHKRGFSHQGPLFGSHSGTLDWDLALPQGQWAIRVAWDGGNPPAATYATAEVTDAGYRSDVYLGMDGSAIAPDAPSGMDVMYYAFDQG